MKCSETLLPKSSFLNPQTRGDGVEGELAVALWAVSRHIAFRALQHHFRQVSPLVRLRLRHLRASSSRRITGLILEWQDLLCRGSDVLEGPALMGLLQGVEGLLPVS